MSIAVYPNPGPVLLGVVVPAEEPEVVEVGCPAVLPRCEVVDVAPVGGDVAAVPAAAAVAGDEGPVLGVGGEAHRATVLDDLVARVEDAGDRGVLGELADDVGGDATAELVDTRPIQPRVVVAEQRLHVDRDQQVDPLPARTGGCASNRSIVRRRAE